MSSLEAHFKAAMVPFAGGVKAADLWRTIEIMHGKPHRHYHTMQHLSRVLESLLPYRSIIRDWTALVFAIAWHDAVYDPLKQDNEARSADLAVQAMHGAQCPDAAIQKVRAAILATAGHAAQEDGDINLFTDADLAILGASTDAYDMYAKQIRLEYSAVPEALYVEGRRRVLQHFLTMPQIYKTAAFFDHYEATARENIAAEISGLQA